MADVLSRITESGLQVCKHGLVQRKQNGAFLLVVTNPLMEYSLEGILQHFLGCVDVLVCER